MKTILLTAAALTLGTSAHAWAGMQKDIEQDSAQAWQGGAKPGNDGMSWADVEMKSKEMVGAATASNASWSGQKSATDAGLNWAGIDMKSKEMVGGTASNASWSGQKAATDAGMNWAGIDMKSKEMVGGAATASGDSGQYMGVGGPVEPRGYPACRPGPGDDNCIQLYERGVRAELAAWKASEGPAMGLGGPLEQAPDAKPEASTAAPATGPKVPDEETDEMAASGAAKDGAADPHAGHDMSGTKPAAAGTPTPNGVGGPLEARSDYPACSARVTDSCIQLYERGVTGAGN